MPGAVSPRRTAAMARRQQARAQRWGRARRNMQSFSSSSSIRPSSGAALSPPDARTAGIEGPR
eukprot:8100877-Pyramimonas_sp.AAC.1